jgi:hypothetical protein
LISLFVSIIIIVTAFVEHEENENEENENEENENEENKEEAGEEEKEKEKDEENIYFKILLIVEQNK